MPGLPKLGTGGLREPLCCSVPPLPAPSSSANPGSPSAAGWGVSPWGTLPLRAGCGYSGERGRVSGLFCLLEAPWSRCCPAQP